MNEQPAETYAVLKRSLDWAFQTAMDAFDRFMAGEGTHEEFLAAYEGYQAMVKRLPSIAAERMGEQA